MPRSTDSAQPRYYRCSRNGIFALICSLYRSFAGSVNGGIRGQVGIGHDDALARKAVRARKLRVKQNGGRKARLGRGGTNNHLEYQLVRGCAADADIRGKRAQIPGHLRGILVIGRFWLAGAYAYHVLPCHALRQSADDLGVVEGAARIDHLPMDRESSVLAGLRRHRTGRAERGVIVEHRLPEGRLARYLGVGIARHRDLLGVQSVGNVLGHKLDRGPREQAIRAPAGYRRLQFHRKRHFAIGVRDQGVEGGNGGRVPCERAGGGVKETGFRVYGGEIVHTSVQLGREDQAAECEVRGVLIPNRVLERVSGIGYIVAASIDGGAHVQQRRGDDRTCGRLLIIHVGAVDVALEHGHYRL